jgi:hypothetical protein
VPGEYRRVHNKELYDTLIIIIIIIIIINEIGVKLDNQHWHEHVPKSTETSRER